MITFIKIPGRPGLTEVGDAHDAGAACANPMTGPSFAATVRKHNVNNPPPLPITRDVATGRHLFAMDDVRAWDRRRPGPGDHGGAGARKRWSAVRAAREAS